jgi:hypothetical protein
MKPLTRDRVRKNIRKGLLTFLVCVSIYIASYTLNSFFGGYWLVPEMDGRDRWSFGLAMMDAIMWQPRFGHEAIGRSDYLGTFYTPLIRFDRKFVHTTIHFFDKDFDQRFLNLKVSQVHPHWRDEFVTKITAAAIRNESEKTIRCTLHYTGSDHPRIISEIWMPRELAKVLEVTPPNGFIEKDFEDYQKYDTKHYIRWVGKLALLKDQDMTLAIPAKETQSGTGRIRFYYERTDATSDDQRNHCIAELK